MPQCAYIRRDKTNCPEESYKGSVFCFWHDEHADKSDEGVKALLEKKVKEDANCEGYKLSKVDLFDGWLTESNFANADFSKVNLSKGHLFGIDFSGANLFKANCSKANLRYAKLRSANILGTNFENSRLSNIDWGDENIVLQEIEGVEARAKRDTETARTRYKEAEEIYLTLKTHFAAKGNSKYTGVFFYREMIAHRMQAPLFSLQRLFMKLADVSCGYGEKIANIFSFSLITVIINAIVFCFGGVSNGDTVFRVVSGAAFADNFRIFMKMMYFSVVTFTTLGYGDLTPASTLTRIFAGVEAFTGAFLVALFVITVSKNLMSR